MSTITLTSDTVEVSFTTAEKVAGLIRDQSIPRAAITAAAAIDDGLSATEGRRAPGLGLPGRRKIGTWRRAGTTQLVAVRRGEPALRITLEGFAYQVAILGTPDAHELARELSDARR